MSYTIRLSDGSELKNLELNGNNFISKKKLTKEDFAGKLRSVEIIYSGDTEHAGYTEKHENMRLESLQKYDGDEYYFVLLEIPRAELEQIRMRANIEYIAMMNDIELEE